jgi:hypothetical protein
MNLTSKKTIATLGLLAASLLPVVAADPTADQLLKQMSVKLAAAKSFTFEATREIDPGLLEGVSVPTKATVSAAVQRPNKLAATATSHQGKRRFIFDGSTLTLLDEKQNHYAKVPMRTSIDGLVDQIDAKYGFVPPLAEFALSNPYKELRGQAQSLTYLGREKTKEGFLGLGGVECHRLWLSGKEADAELWIGVNDQLPRKLTATFHREGKPQVRISFSKWNLAAPVGASEFSFNPPKGSQQIEMWTTAKMQSNSKH